MELVFGESRKSSRRLGLTAKLLLIIPDDCPKKVLKSLLLLALQI